MDREFELSTVDSISGQIRKLTLVQCDYQNERIRKLLCQPQCQVGCPRIDAMSTNAYSHRTMILRLSQKLGTKIKAGALLTEPLGENPFADWSAHLFIVDRTQYILLSNTKSLYSTVMFGQGITNDSRFVDRALSSIRERLEQDGQVAVYDRFIAPASTNIEFAKALSRAVTGSMNELVLSATYALASGEVSPHDVGFELNDLLLSAIATSERDKYGRPKEAFQAMVNAAKAKQSEPK